MISPKDGHNRKECVIFSCDFSSRSSIKFQSLRDLMNVEVGIGSVRLGWLGRLGKVW